MLQRIMKKFFIILLILLFASCNKNTGNQKDIDLFNKGKIFYLNENLQKAIYFFEKAIEENDKYSPAYVMLGKSYYYSREYKKAKEIFYKLLKINKNSIDALNWLARIEGIDERNYEKGLQYCNKVLKLDMNNYAAHFYKAVILHNQGKIKEAIFEYHSALEIEKIIYLSHLQLGELYLQRGVKDKAMNEFEKLLKYDVDGSIKNYIKRRIKEYEKKYEK